MSDRIVIFAGGGSGGHIYPGLAIAEELRRLLPAGDTLSILFVCSRRPLDAQILSQSGERFLAIAAAPLVMTPLGLWRFVWRNWLGVCRFAKPYRAEWRGEKHPHVVTLGGFVAAPVINVSWRQGSPHTLVNLDAVPGKANRWLARRTTQIFTAARLASPSGAMRDAVEIPPIVRASARVTLSKRECAARLGLDPERPILMVTGGSQGLKSLNEFITAFASSGMGNQALRGAGWQVLHQTGRGFDERAKAAYVSAGIDAIVAPFTDQMGMWWGAADAVVCTAGAGNIAEIWTNKVPGLLMPYPHHKDEHQKFNAAPLVEVDGALLGKDLIDPARNLEHNGPALATLLGDSARRATMRANLEKLGPADGATRIAKALLGLR